MRHRDSEGNEGVLGPGDIQWMTAGRGIIHSEIPEMIKGRLKGFQLWVNLPAKLKMIDSSYQDIPANEVPIVDGAGASVRVLSGNYRGTTGPAVSRTKIRLLDIRLKPGTAWSNEPVGGSGLFMCVYEGAIEAADNLGRVKRVDAPVTAIFHGDGPVEIVAGDEGTEILYCEGAPINEPVARYGPFVMNTRAEIEQAVQDYNAGVLTS